jgi:hypothetical protein
MTMTIEELRGWMKLVNTQTLELILTMGDATTPEWFTQEMTAEVQRRRRSSEAGI